MNPIFEWFFQQYENTPQHLITLEIIGSLFGLMSVWFSKRDNILVFPTGIISTAIFVYILSVHRLLGDMMINAYYFIMSIYGWYIWTQKVDKEHFIPITKLETRREYKISVLIFVATLIFVSVVYSVFDKWISWTAYVDTFTTAVFFLGMWLMAKKKLENWQLWIIGNVISIPLYLYKGLVFSAFQYAIFTIIAIYGYNAWKKQLNTPKASLLK
ncbi:nicotinamide riboside transporter PnuC [Mesohalobacter halotolerans]|uniref:Nicotinamide riboside transporter PnuC n=1 Tax=Mesohalobacter halotolerans TaxID=1883405 RepID=A0A4U5TSQ8_9FLAO|nr:nicotinamide riboside transporter PnuC [Mesohalobacter halotolerans]TKS56871.1 nicotinamide mononucleotide transporter [Mesohalobacter halotolerans]